MDGIEIVERIYTKLAESGKTGWMDKKPVNVYPELYFLVSHINTNHTQLLNRVPVNLNVFVQKTESGLPKRDLLKSTMDELVGLFSGVVIDGVYFSASKTFTAFILDQKEYDILTARFDVIVSR